MFSIFKKKERPEEVRSHSVMVNNIEVQTSDYKNLNIEYAIIKTRCPFNYDAIIVTDAIRMAFDVVGHEMSLKEIESNIGDLVEGVMKWNKLPGLLGGIEIESMMVSF